VGKHGFSFTPSVEMFFEAMLHQCSRLNKSHGPSFVECISNSYLLTHSGYIILNSSYNLRPIDREKSHQMIRMCRVIREVITTREDWMLKSSHRCIMIIPACLLKMVEIGQRTDLISLIEQFLQAFRYSHMTT
jgi:hypothetical protein